MSDAIRERNEKLDAIICDVLAVDRAEIKPEARLSEELGGDSLDSVSIIIEIEKAFNVEIDDDEELSKLQTVADVYRLADRVLSIPAIDEGGDGSSRLLP